MDDAARDRLVVNIAASAPRLTDQCCSAAFDYLRTSTRILGHGSRRAVRAGQP